MRNIRPGNKKYRKKFLLLISLIGIVALLYLMSENKKETVDLNIVEKNYMSTNTIVHEDPNRKINEEDVKPLETINSTDHENKRRINNDEIEELKKKVLEEISVNQDQVNISQEFDSEWQKAYMFVIELFKKNFIYVGTCHFALYDMNLDGQPELILTYQYRKNVVFTLTDNKIIVLGEMYNDLYITKDDNGVISYGGWGTGIGGGILYSVVEGKLNKMDMFTYSVSQENSIENYEINGKGVSVEAYNQYVESLEWHALNLIKLTDEISIETLMFYETNLE